jgi:MFS family permease
VLLVVLGMVALPLFGLAGVDSVAAFAVYPLFGAVGGILQPLISDYVNRRIPSSQRATVLSLSQLSFSLVAAGLVPAAGQLGDAFDLQAAYAFIAAFVLVAAVPLVIAFLRADRAAERRRDGETGHPNEAVGAQAAGG